MNRSVTHCFIDISLTRMQFHQSVMWYMTKRRHIMHVNFLTSLSKSISEKFSSLYHQQMSNPRTFVVWHEALHAPSSKRCHVSSVVTLKMVLTHRFHLMRENKNYNKNLHSSLTIHSSGKLSLSQFNFSMNFKSAIPGMTNREKVRIPFPHIK